MQKLTSASYHCEIFSNLISKLILDSTDGVYDRDSFARLIQIWHPNMTVACRTYQNLEGVLFAMHTYQFKISRHCQILFSCLLTLPLIPLENAVTRTFFHTFSNPFAYLDLDFRP